LRNHQTLSNIAEALPITDAAPGVQMVEASSIPLVK
jgi:hypothetical protein